MQTNIALAILRRHRDKLTRQQIKTLLGQILHGDADGAVKGLIMLMQRRTNGG